MVHAVWGSGLLVLLMGLGLRGADHPSLTPNPEADPKIPSPQTPELHPCNLRSSRETRHAYGVYVTLFWATTLPYTSKKVYIFWGL